MPTVRDFACPSDSEEDEKRVVKAHKDRKYEELKDLIKKTKNAKNIKDFSQLLDLYDKLGKSFEKTKPVLRRQNLGTPRFFIRYLAELEDFVNDVFADKEATKALSKVNAKNLPSLRQKMRKGNKEFESDLKKYRESPDPLGFESAEEAEDDDVYIEKKDAAPTKDEKKMKKTTVSDSESDDSEWGSDTGSDTDDSDIDFDAKKMEDLRKYFLKKEFRDDIIEEKDAKKERKEQRAKKQKAMEVVSDEESDDEGWSEVGVKKEEKIVLFEPKQEVTPEVMVEKLDEIMSIRGRKTTNRKFHVRTLQELYNIAVEKNLGAGILVKILFNIVSSLFELNTRISDHMDIATWTKTLGAINSLFDLLIETNVELSLKVTEDEENLINAEEPYRVNGSILMSVQRLDTELTKILQNADCHSTDYIEKLKGEKDICQLIEKAQAFVDERLSLGIFENDEVCKVYMLRIDHLYYKYEDTVEGDDKAGVIMEQLTKKVFALDDEKRLRQRAMLCHVYHLALHDHWHQARDLMLMSHLQAIVDHSDVSTQILYNRTICQLGLCAFRHGFIKEAHQGLSEIQNTQRAKELLAQGVAMRQYERTAEQEKVERGRQIPYHMHINVELMECVYLICSMLLEIPHMASHEFEMRRRLLSRSFHYQLKQSEKSSLVGPPENTREHVVAASRAMLAGEWKKCRDYIVNEKMNQKVWNLFRNPDPVKQMVVGRIQEESLRTYLLMYSTVYTTVSLTKLSALFELDRKQVHAVISKMIINEELSATLDEPTDCLIMHRVEPSRLQLLALNLTDKLQTLAENNEQIMEPRGAGGRGYAGPGVWFAGRTDRDRGDDKKKQGQYQGGRGGGEQRQTGKAWGQGNQQQRRRDGAQKRF